MSTLQRRGHSCLLLLLWICLHGCSQKTEANRGEPAPGPAVSDEGGQLKVYAVSYPLSYFAERLAPAQVEVRFPVPGGVDPAFWKPSVEEIAEFQQADLILLNGAGYARWAGYASLPRSRSVVTARGCRDSFIEAEGAAEHRHGPSGEHAHEGLASTTWLDLGLAICQAEHTRDAIAVRGPASAEQLSEAFESLRADLQALDARLGRATGQWGDRPLLASHPVYAYLAEAYGLHIESLLLEPNEALSADALRQIEVWAAAQSPGPKLMLWEGEPLRETREQLRVRGIEVVVFDPMGWRPKEGDFLSGMSANVARLACAMGTETCQ